MYQEGILVAAGITALKEQIRSLAGDHARAKNIAQGLALIPGVSINPEATEINMVFFTFPPVREPEKAARILETSREAFKG